MDKEEAKFVLQSFRPDGADASDPAFAEALAVAAEDREVGEWLARERASDAAFAAALGSVEIPTDLRDSILQVLAGGGSEDYDVMDAAFVGALASVRPPEGLREQILTAMKMEHEGVVPMRKLAKRATPWKRVASLAAALVLGAFVALQVTGKPKEFSGEAEARNVAQVAIATMGSEGFHLDKRSENPVELVSWLEERQVPAPRALPVGLSGVRGIGCKVLNLNDKKAALICFKLGSGEVVHMVTLNRADIEGLLPDIKEAKGHCHGCEVTGWSSASWSNGDQAYLLLGKMKPEELAEVF